MGRRLRPAGAALLAVALVLALCSIYRPLWHAPFLWDDDAHLSAHRCIVGPLGFREIWTTAEANYFPLVLTHFWVLHRLFGLDPVVYHVVTLALHAFAALALWRVLRRLRVPGAWLGAAWWGLHPVQVKSVAWISEFTNTQSGACFFLGLWFGVRWLDPSPGRKPAWSDYLLAWLCGLAAILSKPSAVMFPVALAWCAWWLQRSWRWRNVLWLLPFLAVSAAASAWAIWEQKFHSGALGADWNQTPAERLVIAGRAVWFYLGRLLWPGSLSFVYPRWGTEVTLVRVLPLVVLVAFGAGIALGRRGWARSLYFAGGFFVAMLFPVLGFFNVYYFRFSFVADHFQYLASAGPLALAGAAVATVANDRSGRAWIYAVAGVLLTALAVRSRSHVHDFVDSDTLWRSTLRHNPTCVVALSNLAISSLTSGHATAARAYGERAVAARPTFGEPYHNLGKAYAALGERTRAVDAYRTALRLDPKLQPAYVSLANVLAGNPATRAEAIRGYETALAMKPDDAIAHTNLALALAAVPGRLDEALGHSEVAARLDPKSAEARFNHGFLLARLPAGAAKAAAEYKAAIALRPDYVKAHLNLGMLWLANPSTLQDAAREFEAALRLDPRSAIGHNDLAVALAQLGQVDAALAHVREALRLDPAYVDARNNLAYLEARRSADRPKP